MAEKVEKCAGCGEPFTTRVLRYVKGPDGAWKYLCTECRRIWHGEYKIDHVGGSDA